MSSKFWLWAAAILLVSRWGLAGERLPTPSDDRETIADQIAALIEQFDAPGFGDRQAASQQLEDVGVAAVAQLELAVKSGGREASGRALDILRRHFEQGSDDARQAVQVLDASSIPLSPRDELAIGRALAAPGPLPRAIAGFGAANRAGMLHAEDRLQYALTLSRANRVREAIAQLDSISEPAPLAGQAAYQRARITMTSAGAPSTSDTVVAKMSGF